jgi:hypothetical protein
MAVATMTALFSVPSQVETIGALAGLAAILGLAVLSMLYFAQARELKRLREWAGRAPERTVEVQQRTVAPVPQRRVAAQPGAAVPGGRPGAAQAATPAGQAATAKPPVPGALGVPGAGAAGAAAAAGAKPATAAGAAGAPATPGAPANGQGDGGRLDDTQVGAPPVQGDQPTTASPAARPGVPTPLPVPAAARAGATPGAPARPRPAQPLRGPGAPSATMPRGPLRDDDPGDGGGQRTRSIVLVVAAVVLVLAAGIFAFTQLGGSDNAGSPTAGAGKTTTTPAKTNTLESPKTTTTGVVPPKADTLVAVLNGTTVPGLARAVADRLETAGYKIGAVTNGPDQQRAATQIAYSPGNIKIARAVAKIIGVGSDAIVPIDDITQQTAGNDALVVVTVGSDQQR